MLCMCVYLREWYVLAHWVFLTGRFALYKSHPLLLLSFGIPTWNFKAGFSRLYLLKRV